MIQRKNESPFFSIVTPVYNRKESIQNAINSVIKQDFVDWEYLIIDDGSTDGTDEVIYKASELDPRILFLRLPNNQGVSAARNLGIQNAKGQFLLFLDSDDEFKFGAFSLLKNTLTMFSNPDAIVFSIDRFDKSVNTSVLNMLEPDDNYSTLDYPAIRSPYLAGMLGVCPHENNHIYRPIVCNKCVRRSVFTVNSILFDIHKITWEDLEVCIKILDGCKRIITIDKALIMDRTSDVQEHLSMRYYPDGAKNVLSEYKWAITKFGEEFDFYSEYALNWYFKNIQIWLLRTMSKDQNRRTIMNEILTDNVFIKIVISRNPEGFFEKAVRKALIKQNYRMAYLLYWVQNFLNRGKCF